MAQPNDCSACCVLLFNGVKPPVGIGSSTEATLTCGRDLGSLVKAVYPQVTICADRATFRAQLKAALSSTTVSHSPAPVLLLIDIGLAEGGTTALWPLKEIIDEEFGGSAGLDSTPCALVVISANSSPLFLRHAIDMGVEHVLLRPLTESVIKTLWLHAVRRQRQFKTGKPRAPALQVMMHKPRTKVQRIADGLARLELAARDATSMFLENPRGMDVADRNRILEENREILHFLDIWDSEEQVREQKLNLRRRLQSWKFDPRKLESEQDVVQCVAVLLEEAADWCGGLAGVGIDKSTLHRFIVAVRSSYNETNPYHNFHHAVDVLQATYVFLRRMKVLLDKEPEKPIAQDEFNTDPALIFARTFFRPHEVFALLVAALCHDLGHPGVNNMYMTSQRTALAELYNDTAVLENFHSAVFFALLRREGISFFGECGDEHTRSWRYRDFRQVVTSSILATDMGQHTDYVKKVQGRQRRYRNPLVERSSPVSVCRISQTGKAEVPSRSPSTANLQELRSEDRILLASILVKCADISNPARPFPIARDWCMSLMEEFEIQRHIECGLVGDDDVVTPASSAKLTIEHIRGQIFFIDKFVEPLWEAVVGDGEVNGETPWNGEVTLSDENLNARHTMWGGLEELRCCRDMVQRNRREWVRLQRLVEQPREPFQPGQDRPRPAEEGPDPPQRPPPARQQSPATTERASTPAAESSNALSGETTRRASSPCVGQVGGKAGSGGRGRVKIVTSFSGQSASDQAFDSRVRTAAFHASNSGIQRFEAPMTHL